MNNNRIRFLAVGYGSVASRMLGIFTRFPWFELTSVSDTSESSLARAAHDLELPDSALHEDMESAIGSADVDVVMINTPSELHTVQVRRCLEAGMHVMVAKPFTLDLGEAVELVSLAGSRGLNLSVAQQMRYNRHYSVLRDYLAADPLGSIEQAMFLSSKPRPDIRNLAPVKQPVLYEMSCHHFDSLLSILPDLEPRTIMIDGFIPSWATYNGPSMINGLLTFSNGLHLLYHAGYSAQADCYELRLEGSRGALRCRGKHMSNDDMAYEHADPAEPWSTMDLDAGKPAMDPFSAFATSWHEYFSGGPEPPFSGRKNLKPLAMVQAGAMSAESGVPVVFSEHELLSACISGQI